ncbi:MAG TPA: leucine dehydrogenase, partial [Dehalococcoidia bacterium]|nr:leucine dehydrogenase [Dehalococcoidia bacterium]
VNQELARKAAAAFGARLVSVEKIFDVECDVFSPNALGASINDKTVPRLHCRIVCGGANNQLATEADGDQLAERGILYAPDFIVNSGGVINVADEAHGRAGYSMERARGRAELVFATTLQILQRAKEQGISPNAAAEQYAKARIQALNAVHRPLVPGRSPIPRLLG